MDIPMKIVPLLAAGLLFSLPAAAEVFVDAGAASARVEAKLADRDDPVVSHHSGIHLGVGARRALGAHSDLGVRLEADRLGSTLLLAARLLDYRYRLGERLAVGAFFGAGRLDLATPAYGWYLGGGVTLRDILPRWDLSLDLRYGDKLARDNLLPTDPVGPSPDNFYKVYSSSLYLSYRF